MIMMKNLPLLQLHPIYTCSGIPLYIGTYYRFVAQKNKVSMPYRYPFAYNITQTEEHITYYDYYLTDFSKFPTSGNFS